ncbi:MAG: efflux RND transporter periplasmic adaptor subunit [Pseudomonadales bacterium]|nr:efflux RND transporter periplasmic adaptor subunit [Pseudomonadales bacterium]
MIRDTSAQDEIIDAGRPLRKLRWLLFIAVLLGLGLYTLLPSLAGWTSAGQSVARERLRTAVVSRGVLNRDISAQGTIVAAIKPTLFSPATGVVTLRVNPGDRVGPGDLIAQIDSPELLSLLQQAQSVVTSAETNLQRQHIQARKTRLQNQQRVDLAEVALIAAQRELRRAEAAHAQDAISEFDFDKANDDVARARLQHQHAQEDARLQAESLDFELKTMALTLDQQRLKATELERQVQELSVLSPVEGIVGNLAVQNKDAVGRNQPLLTVVDLSAFEAELQIPDSYAAALQLGLGAEVSYQGKRFPARVVAVSPEVISAQITTRVRFEGEPPPGLRQNQRVSARILLESKPDTLIVDRGPFLESSGGRYTYVVDGQLARKQRIATGIISVSQVEVLSGLTAGQEIIISGLDDFRDSDIIYLSD